MNALPEVELEYGPACRSIRMIATNEGPGAAALEVCTNAYHIDGPWLFRVVPTQTRAAGLSRCGTPQSGFRTA